MKQFTTLLSVITLLLFSSTISAQDVHKYCGHDNVIQKAIEENPTYLEEYVAKFNDAKESGSRLVDTTYTIQVVVHILYEEGDEYQLISDELIHSQIDALNRDFNLQNDTSYTRDVFKPIVGQANINFELARVRPNGNCTNGIIRKAVDISIPILPSITDFQIKDDNSGGSSAFNTNKYLNIWVVDLNKFGDPTQGFLGGFAYFPDMNPKRFNGVVIDFRFFGQNNPYVIEVQPAFGRYARGRTTVHEVGHWLGLFHTWGALGQLDPSLGCNDDDFIDDTPLNTVPYASHGRCEDTIVNSCITEPIDFPDMFENYMDYSSDDCYTMFTVEQVAVMRGIMENDRSELNWVPESPITTQTIDVTVLEGESIEVCFSLENCFVQHGPHESTINGMDSMITTDLGTAELIAGERCINYTASNYDPNDEIDEIIVEIYDQTLDKIDLVEINITIEQNPILGIDFISNAKNSIDVFPNPTSGQFRVNFNDIMNNLNIYVYDAIGQLVISKVVNGERYIDFDLSNLSDGAYILQFENDEFKTFEKILLK